MTIRFCHDNPQVKAMYDNYLGKPGSQIAHELTHTSFVDRSWEINGK